MYEEDEAFESPADPNATIWRYMTLSKLVDMFDKRALFFSRSDLLGDPFEGSTPAANVAQREQMWSQIPWTDSQVQAGEPVAHNQGDALTRREMARCMAVNCWHMNEHESASMWQAYARNGEGVALRSTFARLVESLLETPERVYIGTVKYHDYSSDAPLEFRSNFDQFTYKRKSFEHERELRVFLPKFRPGLGDPRIDSGLLVNVDLLALLQEIKIAPQSTSWFADVVQAVVGRFDVRVPIARSALDEEALW